MLARVDRVQLAAADRKAVTAALVRLLGAAPVREDAVQPLAARRTTLALGTSEIEILAPDGPGPVAHHLSTHGPGLFAAGFAVADPDALRSRLAARRVAFAEAGEQTHLAPDATGGHGLRCVLSPARPAPAPVGLVTHLYEVTNLVGDAAAVTAHYADLFGLDAARFCPITSAEYGYRGTLTMFDPTERLDRIEVITPYDDAKTMGRFMHKHGPSLYMCFAESADTPAIRARLEEHAPGDWTGSRTDPVPDVLFLHPKALGGTMLGVSRTTYGWIWSGRAERVRPAATVGT